LPFRAAFDGVILAGGLEFVEDPAAALRELRRCLVERGRAVVLFPPLTLLGRLYWLYHRAHRLSITLFRPDALLELVARLGLAASTPVPVHPYAMVVRLTRAR
jgi:ubiquinone/menaquinone biosynthesis C-methylase UbiE